MRGIAFGIMPLLITISVNFHFLWHDFRRIGDLKKRNLRMSRISGIIGFQTKESNLERDLRKETDIKLVRKENLKFSVLKLISRAKLLAYCSFEDH